MELKVWVDGVARVVCGLSLSTSCQDVVIALAQSIGQTGRYILVMKLRGNERQLLADDCPLQHAAQLGQQAAEVQFILRRTGPALGGDHEPARAAGRRLPPSRPDPDHRSAGRASSTLPRRSKAGRVRSSSATDSPEPRASPIPFLDTPSSLNALPYVSKEEVFRQILQQQKTLQDLEVEVQALERETGALEQLTSSATLPGPVLDLREQLEELERRQLHNKEELILGEQWEELLQAEMDKERDMHERLSQARASLHQHTDQITALQASSGHLEQEAELTVQRRRSAARQSEEALRLLRQEFNKRQQHTQQLEATLSASQRELSGAERALQERQAWIQALNRELRQCDLQHFIQQTGPHADPTGTPQLGSTVE
ncbi:ras association domain-containing protein 7-like isoform X2 [Betta splendens]|nr:ras association domain-containing protein 7-like isoform X2 [Betta splendens]